MAKVACTVFITLREGNVRREWNRANSGKSETMHVLRLEVQPDSTSDDGVKHAARRYAQYDAVNLLVPIYRDLLKADRLLPAKERRFKSTCGAPNSSWFDVISMIVMPGWGPIVRYDAPVAFDES